MDIFLLLSSSILDSLSILSSASFTAMSTSKIQSFLIVKCAPPGSQVVSSIGASTSFSLLSEERHETCTAGHHQAWLFLACLSMDQRVTLSWPHLSAPFASLQWLLGQCWQYIFLEQSLHPVEVGNTFGCGLSWSF